MNVDFSGTMECLQQAALQIRDTASLAFDVPTPLIPLTSTSTAVETSDRSTCEEVFKNVSPSIDVT